MMKKLIVVLLMVAVVSAAQAEVIWWDGCSTLDEWTEWSQVANEEGSDFGVIGVVDNRDNPQFPDDPPDGDGKEIQMNSWWGSGADYGTWADIWTTNPVGTVQADKNYTLTATIASWDDGTEPEDSIAGTPPSGAGDVAYVALYYYDVGDVTVVMVDDYAWTVFEQYSDISISFSTEGGANAGFVGKDMYAWITLNGWWNNLSVSEVRVTDTAPLTDKASNPIPTDGEVDIPVTVVLTWDAAIPDPNVRHRLYFGESPDLTPRGSFDYDITKVLASDFLTVTPGTDYTWRIDEFNPVAGTTVTGDTWSFTTDFAPIITAQPASAFANPNGSMTVTAMEYSGGTANLSYQWYDTDGPLSDDGVISGSTASAVGTSTLTFTAPGEDYVGSYYCIVTDTSQSASTKSDTALLEKERLYAHFTFEPDTVDPVDGWVENVINGELEGQYSWDTTLGGPVTFGPGYIGTGAVEFEDLLRDSSGSGDDEWIWMDQSILAPVEAVGSKEITIAMWAYLADTVTHRQALFSTLDTDNWLVNLGVYCPTANGGGTIRFEDQEGAEFVEWDSGDPNAVLLDGQWHHFAFSKNVDTGEMKLYFDGDLKQTTNATLSDIHTEASAGVYLGVSAEYGEAFTGSIDDFRLYNYALSDAEVLELYECSPIVYDLDFDCDVDLVDFSVLAGLWLDQYDITDLAGLSGEWLTNK